MIPFSNLRTRPKAEKEGMSKRARIGATALDLGIVVLSIWNATTTDGWALGLNIALAVVWTALVARLWWPRGDA
jgi:hypothetical protein